MRELAVRYLDAGDPHVARVILTSSLARDDDPIDRNLLGVASYKAGDINGAWEAFSLAAKGGLEVGRQNLTAMLRNARLDQWVGEVAQHYPEGKSAGRVL